jgi:peptidoglycan/xylan/chitin deacetylase (PgdA/CDA1 family)
MAGQLSLFEAGAARTAISNAASPAERLFDATGFLDELDVASPRSPMLNRYYSIKPLIPRPVQLAARRLYAKRQARRGSHSWPIEPLRVRQLQDRLRAEADFSGRERVPFVGFWPERRRFAVILTHDVEGPAGVENISDVLELERRYGMRSSWNLVGEDYAIDPQVFATIRDSGGEIGLHGLHHDGLLFADRESFTAQLPRIRALMDEWGAVGFRSPATHRNPEWMPELGCEYDSSFPDTDPFEPQAASCCPIWPFFLGDLVELPITMPQDHTLFAILGEDSITRWVQKSDWLAANHGLINVLVHPDYVHDGRQLEHYEQLLAHLSALSGGWHALPREVAAWWRARRRVHEQCAATGLLPEQLEQGHGAATAYARLEGEDIAFEI